VDLVARSGERASFRRVTPLPLLLGGQTLELFSERAVFWRERRMLWVADCHFGKSASFRHHGVAVPEGGTADDLGRLDRLIDRTGAKHLLVAGDFFHAPTGYTAEVLGLLAEWRGRQAGLTCTLVPGNHDRSLQLLPAGLGLEVVDEPHQQGPFQFVHDPGRVVRGWGQGGEAGDGGPWRIGGHLHPRIRLGGGRERGLRAPCFWLRRDLHLVLPSFGGFTGGVDITPVAGDRVFAVAGERVVEVPAVLMTRARGT